MVRRFTRFGLTLTCGWQARPLRSTLTSALATRDMSTVGGLSVSHALGNLLVGCGGAERDSREQIGTPSGAGSGGEFARTGQMRARTASSLQQEILRRLGDRGARCGLAVQCGVGFLRIGVCQMMALRRFECSD